jgi:hypothetical protein
LRVRIQTLSITCVVLDVILGLAGAPARAGDIPTITVTAAGPDKSIPTDAAFYIAGNAKLAKRAQVVIVRTGSPWIWRSHRTECEDVNKKLGKFVGGDGKALPSLTAQTTTADKIWQGGDPAWDVRLSPSATPEPAGDFKILIDHDEFFTAGHGYCFYVYVDNDRADLTIADAVVEAVTAAVQCSAATGCAVETDLAAKIPAKIDAQTTDPKLREQLKAAVTASIGAAKTMATDAHDLALLFDQWSPGAIKPYNFPVLVDAPFASAVAAMLALNNQLQPVIHPGRQSLIGYFTKAGKIVRAVGLTASGQIRVATDTGGRTAEVLDATAAALAIPDSPSTLQDLLELAGGRLPFGKEYLEPGAYHQRIAPILVAFAQPLTPDQAAVLASAHDSLAALHQTLVHIHDAYDGKQRPVEGSKAAILWDLGKWLETTVETPCNPRQWVGWGQVATDEAGCMANPGKRAGWATYVSQTSTLEGAPLAIVVSDLWDFKGAQALWVAVRPTINQRSTTAFSHTISTTIEVTRETWVFSYLSPVVGYAAASPVRDGSHEGITLHYFAVQLHVKPNPAHLPAGGIGMFALEVGASPGIGSFGPDQRYRGIGNISPVFAGLAVHLIPYTAVSAGVLFGERRSSTVGQEDYHTFGAGYVGLTVDLNIPQLVVGSKTTTTTTNGTAGN